MPRTSAVYTCRALPAACGGSFPGLRDACEASASGDLTAAYVKG